MPALGQHLDTVAFGQRVGRIEHLIVGKRTATGQYLEFGLVGRDDGGDVHQRGEPGDRLVVGQHRSAGRHHDRVEHDRAGEGVELLGQQPSRVSGEPSMPILIASAPMSDRQLST